MEADDLARLLDKASNIEAPVAVALTATEKFILDRQRAAIPVDTGRTRATITATRTGPLSVEIGTSDPVGRFLEYGTSKMPPRPWAYTSTDEAQQLLANGAAEAAERLFE